MSSLNFILSLLSLSLFISTVYLVKKLLKAKESETVLNVELNQLKERMAVQKTLHDLTNEHLTEKFKNLATTALEGNSEQFLKLAKLTLEKETELANKTLSEKQDNFDKMVSPIKDLLKEQKEHLFKIEKERSKYFTEIEAELKKVSEAHILLASQTGELKNALKKPHVRGRWGEVQLKNCIEIAGMNEYCDLNFQDVKALEDNKRLIPDLTVKMPGGHIAIVDAKTPIDAFIDYIEEVTEEVKKEHLERHARHVKDHIKKLSSKEYQNAFENSADFTVMFLPNESFLYAALEAQPDIVEYAIQKKILISTPPTFIGFLKVILHGWNEKQLSENAKLISEVGTELHKRLCDFLDAYKNIGKHIEKALDEFKTGKSRIESRVLTQAVRLEKLGAKSSKDIPTEYIEEVNQSPEA